MIEYVLEMDDVERVHGRGETAVHALRGVSLGVAAGRARRGHGPVGLGQVDAAQPRRRARPRRRRAPSASRAVELGSLSRARAGRAAAPQRRLRLPGVQPHPGADRRRERGAPARARRRPRSRSAPGGRRASSASWAPAAAAPVTCGGSSSPKASCWAASAPRSASPPGSWSPSRAGRCGSTWRTPDRRLGLRPMGDRRRRVDRPALGPRRRGDPGDRRRPDAARRRAGRALPDEPLRPPAHGAGRRCAGRRRGRRRADRRPDRRRLRSLRARARGRCRKRQLPLGADARGTRGAGDGRSAAARRRPRGARSGRDRGPRLPRRAHAALAAARDARRRAPPAPDRPGDQRDRRRRGRLRGAGVPVRRQPARRRAAHVPSLPPHVLAVDNGDTDARAMVAADEQAAAELPDASAHVMREPLRSLGAGESVPSMSEAYLRQMYITLGPAAAERMHERHAGDRRQRRVQRDRRGPGVGRGRARGAGGGQGDRVRPRAVLPDGRIRGRDADDGGELRTVDLPAMLVGRDGATPACRPR